MTPKRAWVVVRYEVDMNGWDDDVDWSDPERVIREQYETAGLTGLLPYDDEELLEVKWK